MSALPADLHPDPLDPVSILADLPEDERDGFTEEYRRLIEAARDPVGYQELHRYLRGMRWHAEQTKDPEYWRAYEEACRATGTEGAMSLADLRRLRQRAS